MEIEDADRKSRSERSDDNMKRWNETMEASREVLEIAMATGAKRETDTEE